MALQYFGIIEGTVNKSNGIIKTSRKFVYLATDGVNPLAILDDENLPALYSQHPVNPLLICNIISVPELQGGDGRTGGKYEVVCSYTNSNAALSAVETPRSNEPWNDPPYNFRIDTIEYPAALTKAYKDNDTQGNPSVDILNKAGDPLDIEGVKSNLLLSFSYNLEEFKYEWIKKYKNTINKTAITVTDISIPAKQGLIRKLSPNLVRVYDSTGAQSYIYYRIDAEIEISDAEFKIEPMNVGYNFKSGNDRVRIYTDDSGHYGSKETYPNGSPVDTPVKLDKNGAILEGSAAIYLNFQDKFAANWSTIALPEEID